MSDTGSASIENVKGLVMECGSCIFSFQWSGWQGAPVVSL